VGEAHISTERKTRARIRGENPSILALSVYNKGLGLAHNAFDQSNAMLALLSKSKFSAKDITLSSPFLFSKVKERCPRASLLVLCSLR
jgi:hypothetical protein